MSKNVFEFNSWKRQIPIVPFYKGASGEESIDLAHLISTENITLNVRRHGTGFDGIAIKYAEVPKEREWVRALTNADRYPDSTDLKQYITDYVKLLKKYFIEQWDNSKFHLILMSGGADSRIISWILKELRDEYGQSFLGDLCFVCHHDEDAMFLEVMKLQGWKPEQYHVHKAALPQSASYYDYGDFDDNANSYTKVWPNFWNEVLPKFREKEAVVVTGFNGGEQFEYPVKYSKTSARSIQSPWWNIFKFSFTFEYYITKYWLKFYEVLMPYCDYDVVAHVSRVPYAFLKKAHWPSYKQGNFCDRRRDFMRRSILDHFGDYVPCHVEHNYIFDMTPERTSYMKEKWFSSKFYRDFKDDAFVQRAEPWNLVFYKGNPVEKKMKFDNGLYSLATCYEQSTR